MTVDGTSRKGAKRNAPEPPLKDAGAGRRLLVAAAFGVSAGTATPASTRCWKDMASASHRRRQRGKRPTHAEVIDAIPDHREEFSQGYELIRRETFATAEGRPKGAEIALGLSDAVKDSDWGPGFDLHPRACGRQRIGVPADHGIDDLRAGGPRGHRGYITRGRGRQYSGDVGGRRSRVGCASDG